MFSIFGGIVTDNKSVKICLVLGILVLLVGVGIQPAFAKVSINSDDSELEVVTIQFYETDRTYNHTVFLTQEQAEELENLINNIEFQLYSTDNPIETEAIYNNAIVSFNELGLIPKDMSIDYAQRLVTGKEQDPRIVEFLERWISKNKKGLSDNENFNCLIAGFTSHTHFLGPIGRILYYLIDFLPFGPLLALILVFLLSANYIWSIVPLQFGYEIGIGFMTKLAFDPEYYPAKGRVYTIGSNGVISWDGAFYGHIPLFPFAAGFSGYKYCFPGVLGFTGIKIGFLSSHFYMGFAQQVKIDKERPEYP